MLEFYAEFIYWLLDMPSLHPIGCSLFLLFDMAVVAAIMFWPLPPIEE